MQKKRLRLIIWNIAIVVITLLAIAGSHIYNNVGSLYSDEISMEKFGVPDIDVVLITHDH